MKHTLASIIQTLLWQLHTTHTAAGFHSNQTLTGCLLLSALEAKGWIGNKGGEELPVWNLKPTQKNGSDILQVLSLSNPL